MSQTVGASMNMLGEIPSVREAADAAPERESQSIGLSGNCTELARDAWFAVFSSQQHPASDAWGDFSYNQYCSDNSAKKYRYARARSQILRFQMVGDRIFLETLQTFSVSRSRCV